MQIKYFLFHKKTTHKWYFSKSSFNGKKEQLLWQKCMLRAFEILCNRYCVLSWRQANYWKLAVDLFCNFPWIDCKIIQRQHKICFSKFEGKSIYNFVKLQHFHVEICFRCSSRFSSQFFFYFTRLKYSWRE